MSIEELCHSKPLIVLDEVLEINMYYDFRTSRNFFINKVVTYRILNENGAKLLEDIVLPENPDPTLVHHNSDVKKMGYFISSLDVDNFELNVVRQDKPIKIKTTKKSIAVESYNMDFLYTFNQIHYRTEGLQTGDLVTVKYQINFPHLSNISRLSSYRIFFHDSIPKLKTKLKVSHSTAQQFELYGFNGASEIVKTSENEGRITYEWVLSNLPGVLMQEGSRPYLELPHITWVISPELNLSQGTITVGNHIGIIVGTREPLMENICTKDELGMLHSQYLLFNRKYDTLTTGINEGYERIKYIHNYIADEFRYKNDIDYYRQLDSRGERLGMFFENNELPDHSRYYLYASILSKSGLVFYASFLVDKRFGELSKSYFRPNYESDFLMSLHSRESGMNYMHPKSGEFGWYYNELPFYWENCTSHSIDFAQRTLDKSKMVMRKIIQTTTPITSPKDNRRQLYSNVQIKLEEDSAFFNSKLRLSGQFSTLCRAIYQNKQTDPTVNVLYRKPVWNIDGLSHLTCTNTLLSKEAPFKHEFSCRYSAGNILKKEGKDASLDIQSWITHILPLKKDDVRYLNFYSDFKGRDEYRYQVQFDKAITLLNDTLVEIDTNYGKYTYSVMQVKPEVIQINSVLEIHSDGVLAENYDQVLEIVKLAGSIPTIRFTVN